MKTIQIFQYSTIVFTLVVLLTACRSKEGVKCKYSSESCLVEGSDYLIPLVADCRASAFPRQSGGISILPKPSLHTYGDPVLSPINSNEILFQRTVRDSFGVTSVSELWKMNICSGERYRITTDVYGFVSWSVKDWLAIHTLGNGTWIMKSNGDSLINLPDTYSNFAWSPDGNQLLTKLENEDWVLLDRFGDFKKKLESIRGHANPRWSPDGKKIAFSGFNPAGQRIWIYDLDKQQYHNILSVGSTYVWEDDNHLITPSERVNLSLRTGYDDMARIDIHTSEIEVIKEWCGNRVYSPNSISPDGKYLITRLALYEAIVSGGAILKYSVKIVVMNLDGSNEREVVINW